MAALSTKAYSECSRPGRGCGLPTQQRGEVRVYALCAGAVRDARHRLHAEWRMELRHRQAARTSTERSRRRREGPTGTLNSFQSALPVPQSPVPSIPSIPNTQHSPIPVPLSLPLPTPS